MRDLAGKAAFISGGASGIGLGMAQAFAAAGMKLVLADIDGDAASRAETLLRDSGAQALAVECDVTDATSWEAALDRAEAAFGPVAVQCNNAGVGQGRFGGGAALDLADMPEILWRLVIDTNLTGVFLGVRAGASRMVARGCGHIVNTASMAGLIAPPGLGAYAASKFAVLGMSEALCGELAPAGVGVSVLCPGGVDSNLVSTSAARRSAVLGEAAGPTLATRRPASDGHRMNAVRVGERVLAAIRANEFYIFTHPEYAGLVDERIAALRAAFGASAEPGYSDPLSLLDRSRNPTYSRQQDQQRQGDADGRFI